MNDSTETGQQHQLQEAAAALAKVRQESDTALRQIFQALGGFLAMEVPDWLQIGWDFRGSDYKTHRATGRRLLLQGPGVEVKVSPQGAGDFFPHAIPWTRFREMCGDKWPGMLLEPIQKKIKQERAALEDLQEKKQQTDDLKKAGRGDLFVI